MPATKRMRLFNTLSLEINSRCNRSCSFCPVAYNTRPEEKMSAGLVDKALVELGGLRYQGRIEFYIYNEPTRDMPWLLQCIALARRLVPRSCLMVASNGDYLRGPLQIMQLYQAGLNQLLINCYSPGLYQRRLPWLADLPIGISRTDSVYATLGPKRRTIQMLDKSNPHDFGQGVFRLINRAGNIPAWSAPLAKPAARMCVKPFRLLNINWQGAALLCCNDYHGQLHIGNLRECSLVELWNSPVLNTYRKHLLAYDRYLPLCNKCDCHAGAYPHNVDKNIGPTLTDAAVRNRFHEK